MWGIKKGVEFATWLTEKRDPSITSSAKTSPSGPAKGLETGTVVVAKTSSPPMKPALVTAGASLPKVEAKVEPKAEINVKPIEDAKAEIRTETNVAQSVKVVYEEASAPKAEAVAQLPPQVVAAASVTGDSKDPPKRSYSPYKKVGNKGSK